MRRRLFIGAATASLMSPLAFAATNESNSVRLQRPDLATDEGGLWALMDREETKLRRSPFLLRDAPFQAYVQEIACRLGGDHCPDIRVQLVRNRHFNAMMAPNGMMQVWSGLMLRVENEAQLAAVLGHEIGHYVERHSLAMLRDAKSRSAFISFMAVFGAAGLIGQLASIGGALGFSRDNERKADEIGLHLMSKAGYDPREAAKVWHNMLLEAKADPVLDPTKGSIFFATHPPIEERRETLTNMASTMPQGQTNAEQWQARIAPYRLEWLNEEVKRNAPLQSLVLLSRLIEHNPQVADYSYARAEVYRLRAKDNDYDLALSDYHKAQSIGKEPAETHRGIGMIHRERKHIAQSKAAFIRYLELAPEASDSLMIKSYVEETSA